MKGSRQVRRLSLVCGFAAAFALAAAPAVADRTLSELYVTTYNQTAGQDSDIDLEVALVASAPAVESMALTVPAGYRMTEAPVGTRHGPVDLGTQPAVGGSTTTLKGTIVEADPATLTTNPEVQICAPGPHERAWNLVLSGFTIPVAIDRLSSGGGFRLVVCLDALRASNVKPVDLYLETTGVFGNPTGVGTYVWSALVTAFNAVNAPDPTTAFELRSDDFVPETLSLKPSLKKTTLTLRGTLLAAAKPRVGVRVHLLAGTKPVAQTMKDIGVAVTNSSGAYVFHKRMAKAPRYVWAYVNFYFRTGCEQPSTAPAGCASETYDGTASVVATVPQPKKRSPKRT